MIVKKTIPGSEDGEEVDELENDHGVPKTQSFFLLMEVSQFLLYFFRFPYFSL